MGKRPEVGARGFTLLELIVVLLVLAVAAGLAMPAIGRSVDAVRVRAEIAGFSAVLRHAREQAIVLRRVHAVVVDPTEHQVRILADDEVRKTRAIPAGWTIEASPPPNLTVRFEPQGSSSGGDFRIVAGPVTYRITVDAVTGRVRSLRE